MNLGGIKVGCAEIERTLNTVPGVRETAAVAVSPPDGGPSRLVIFAIADGADDETALTLQAKFQHAIRRQLNPLFSVAEVRIVPDFHGRRRTKSCAASCETRQPANVE